MTDTRYEREKERLRQHAADVSLSGRDIKAIPAVVNPERRARACLDLEFFCLEYFPELFTLPFSDDHRRVIAKLQRAVLEGGLFAVAMPRGSGKTTLAETGALWAEVIGARSFVCLIGSDEGHAAKMLDSLKTEFETNEALLEDFPEVVYPIRCLERIAQRAVGQLFQDKPTRIGWTAQQIILPTIPGSRASGSIIRAVGLTGGLRGMKHKRADGSVVRPSLVILDDPQTDESARSLSQCATRESILAGAVLGLAGPGQKIAGVMPCTVIKPGDMADKILDRQKHPQWQGERTKMVYAFPSNTELWDKYAEIRAESFRADGDGSEATEFYSENREAMDAGAVIAWPERFNHDELSAIQHAENLKLQDERAFFAEYQNDPLPEDLGDASDLTTAQVAAKINRLPRGQFPVVCHRLTMFVDAHKNVLYYATVAWGEDFGGYVVDYGTFPDQCQAYFTLRDARHTLNAVTPGTGFEGTLYAGLDKFLGSYLAREWERDDGAILRIGRCLIDANWEASTAIVYQFCRQSAHAAVLMPSHGKYVGAGSKPFNEYKRKRGDRIGHNWRVPGGRGRGVRYVAFDANFWKTFVHARLAVVMGDKGCLSIFGTKPERHRLFAEHLTAEYRVKTEGRERTVDEWKQRPDRPDNHWFDCLVGCAVAASMQGIAQPGIPAGEVKRKRVYLDLAEMAKAAKR